MEETSLLVLLFGLSLRLGHLFVLANRAVEVVGSQRVSCRESLPALACLGSGDDFHFAGEWVDSLSLLIAFC